MMIPCPGLLVALGKISLFAHEQSIFQAWNSEIWSEHICNKLYDMMINIGINYFFWECDVIYSGTLVASGTWSSQSDNLTSCTLTRRDLTRHYTLRYEQERFLQNLRGTLPGKVWVGHLWTEKLELFYNYTGRMLVQDLWERNPSLNECPPLYTHNLDQEILV